MGDDGATLSEEQLDHLAQYFNEEVTFSRHIGAKVEEVEPGRAVLHIDVEEIHLNGNGTLHGGVHSALIDNAMGLSVSSLVGLRTATTQMDVHFLGAVKQGRITCRSEVVHKTRRTATAEGRVYDEEGNLVAVGMGAFRIFEKKGDPIV
ncbi:MAG: PaaI family thioesterase [Actinomycetota bacterium]|nr:PaaI family thioesterase [Actinomycetota bacterium]